MYYMRQRSAEPQTGANEFRYRYPRRCGESQASTCHGYRRNRRGRFPTRKILRWRFFRSIQQRVFASPPWWQNWCVRCRGKCSFSKKSMKTRFRVCICVCNVCGFGNVCLRWFVISVFTYCVFCVCGCSCVCGFKYVPLFCNKCLLAVSVVAFARFLNLTNCVCVFVFANHYVQ